MKKINENTNVPVILVGNKNDLVNERKISYDEG
jgi:GTPase SAR1 family protein